MQYQSDTTDNEVQALPPMITNNIREKIYPEQVSIRFTFITKEKHDQQKKLEYMQPTSQLPSSFSLNVVYYPKVLDYEIGDKTAVHSLRVWNASMRSLYITCKGIMNNSEDGAIWFSYPRTRSLLAPGLATSFNIKAIPKNVSPVSSLRLALQLAAAFKRDGLVTYYSVPIVITFLNYAPPCLPEEVESISFHPSLGTL